MAKRRTTNNGYFISILSLLFSAVNLVLFFYQINQSDNFVKKQDWPKLEINYSNEGSVFVLYIQNKGMGLATIDEITMYHGNNRYDNFRDFFTSKGLIFLYQDLDNRTFSPNDRIEIIKSTRLEDCNLFVEEFAKMQFDITFKSLSNEVYIINNKGKIRKVSDDEDNS